MPSDASITLKPLFYRRIRLDWHHLQQLTLFSLTQYRFVVIFLQVGENGNLPLCLFHSLPKYDRGVIQ